MKEYQLAEGSSVSLDLIRGISAQLVLVGHGINFFGIFNFLKRPNFPYMQNIAVLVFFLLSGFIITYSTLAKVRKNHEYSFSSYFIDRFSRIYTPFLPALLFVFLIDFASKSINEASYSYNGAFNFETLLGNIFMFQDFPVFRFITSFGSARPFWTIAIEWWIYLFFGFLFFKFLKKERFEIKHLAVLGFLSIYPLYNFIGGRGNGLTVYWVFGSVVYLVFAQNIFKNVNIKTKLLLLFSVLSLAAIRISILTKKGDSEYDTILAFFLAMSLFFILDISSRVNFSPHVIKLIKLNASYSYTLYLIHCSILDFFAVHFKEGNNPYLLFALCFVFSNITSMLLGRYTEITLTKKIKTFFYKISEKKKIISPFIPNAELDKSTL